MKKILLILTLAVSVFANAQQLPFGSMYYANMLSLNPAYTGFNPETEVFLSHRSQFVGFQNSPQTNFLSAAGNMSEKVGIGLTAYSDQTALFRKTNIMANYAYSLKFGADQFLHFGLGAGVNSVGLDLSNGNTVDVNDPIFGTLAQNRMGFNADFGLLYQFQKLEVGFSVPQLFNNTTIFYLENDQKYTYRNTTHFRGSAKYDFFFGKESLMKVYPMLMMRYVKGAPVQYDLSAVFDHKNWGWLGVTYHSDFAIAASVGVRYKNLGFGYAHDFIVGPLRRLGKFSSEFVLSYRFEDKNKAKKSNSPFEKNEEASAKEEKSAAPTDDELAKLRAEVEKLRREKAAMQDSLNRSSQIEGEEKMLKEEEKTVKENANNPTTKPVKEEMEPAVPLTKKEARQKKRADRKAKRKGLVQEEETEAIIEEEKQAEVKTPEEAKPTETKIDKDQLVFESKENFVTEAGETPEEGFYIILGAFANPANTKRFVSILEEYEFENIQVIRNKEKGLDEVCVYYSSQIGDSRKILLQYREEGRKSWILNLK